MQTSMTTILYFIVRTTSGQKMISLMGRLSKTGKETFFQKDRTMQVYFDSNNHAALSLGLCYHILTQLYFKLQPSSLPVRIQRAGRSTDRKKKPVSSSQD